MELRWDDLKFLLAVGREGTIRAAARELGVNHATISRHLKELQESLGVRAFERDGRRIQLTSAGTELMEVAKEIETQILDITRKVAGQSAQLQGHVRIALTESMLEYIAPFIGEFRELYPGIALEFVVGLEHKNLSRNEADIALRATNSPHETLVGRQVSTFRLRVYGAKKLLDALEPCELDGYPWIGWVGRDIPISHPPPSFFISSETSLLTILRAGLAVGYMPSLLGDQDPSLRPIAVTVPTYSLALWVLTHEDLKHTPRIRAVTGWLSELLRTHITPVSGGELWPPGE